MQTQSHSCPPLVSRSAAVPHEIHLYSIWGGTVWKTSGVIRSASRTWSQRPLAVAALPFWPLLRAPWPVRDAGSMAVQLFNREGYLIHPFKGTTVQPKHRPLIRMDPKKKQTSSWPTS